MIVWATLMYYSAFILWFDHFLDSEAEICQIFLRFFLENLKESKRQSEINWSLEDLGGTFPNNNRATSNCEPEPEIKSATLKKAPSSGSFMDLI